MWRSVVWTLTFRSSFLERRGRFRSGYPPSQVNASERSIVFFRQTPGSGAPAGGPRTSIAHTPLTHGAQAGSRAAPFSRRAQRGRRVCAATLDAAWAPWSAGRAMDSGPFIVDHVFVVFLCFRRETAWVTSSPPLSGDRCGLSCASCEVHTSARARDGAVDRAVRSPRRYHRGVCPSRPRV